jgi:hypothetical protein
MANSPVLTDQAKFKCAHMPAPLGVTEGISISLKAAKISVDNAKPILNGAVIGGFTPASGCTFQVSGVAKPCDNFQLSAAPATGLLDEGGQKVYLAADSSAIALVPSTGNAIPGLTIIETQIKLKA